MILQITKVNNIYTNTRFRILVSPMVRKIISTLAPILHVRMLIKDKIVIPC